jgi:CspA family cold shock protein
MPKGTVKFFNAGDGSNDLFVHVSDVADNADLQDGQPVEFEVGEGKKGPCAVNVK